MNDSPRLAATLAAVMLLNILGGADLLAKDSLPPLTDGKVPQNLDELWGTYDPTSEPLEVNVVREWEEDGVVIKYVTYTIGTFKGQKSTMSAFYAFPKGEKKLPAILEIHGGGGKAELNAAKWGAWNGYATLSVNWGGRVPLEDLTDSEPNTDWGALDATQQHNCHYNSLAPDHLTLDAVESPRNNNWFLLTLGCRRGITFLEQQAEVDPKLIGVTGHSMGGKLTVDVAAIDNRVEVAVPSCGGTGSARDILSGMPGAGAGREQSQLLLDAIDDVPYLKRLTCPIMFISPANDFAGPMDNMYINQRYVDNSFFYYAITPHRNHQHDEAFSVNTLLTFAQFLKKGFTYPKAPELTVNLKTEDGIPEVKLVADPSRPIEKVDIYYSVDPHALTRFWRSAEARKQGDSWVAKAPIMSTSHPLFFYANVTYRDDLSKLYMHRTRESYDDRFALSSNMIRLTSDELKAAGVKATDRPTRVVEDFERDWRDWFLGYWDNPHHWNAATRKMKDPKYRPPRGAKLLLDVKIEEDNTLVYEFRCNAWNAYPHRPVGTFIAAKEIKGSPDWQTIEVSESDLRPSTFPRGKTDPLPKSQWEYVTEFSLRCKGSVIRNGELIDVSRAWRGGREFRNLRWVGGRYPEKIIVSGGAVSISEEDLNAEIGAAIDESWEEIEDFFGEPDTLGRYYLTPAMATEIDSYMRVGQDTTMGGNSKISVGGKTYERGLGVHAKSKLAFPLDGKFAEFHVVPGPEDSQGGLVEMKILVDGREVFTSGPVTRHNYTPSPLTVPVSGAKKLTLIVTEGGNGPGGDHANWADAYLTKGAAAPSSSETISQKDYSYAYWKNGWRKHTEDTSPNILCFESGTYGFMLDVAKLAKPKFGLFNDDSSVLSCLEAGTQRMDTISEADLDVSLELDGKRYSLESCLAGESGNLAFARMMEAGQVAQHFEIQHLIFKDDEGKRLGCYGDLDMVAWPDSLTFTLKLMPDLLYEDGPSEGVVGTGHCIIEKPLDIPHQDEIDPEVFTVECWMKTPKSIDATGNFILCKNTHGWQDGNFTFRFWGRNVSAEMNIGGGRENRHSLNFGHHRRNEWNHYALTYDGKDMKVYLNGNLSATTTIGKKRTPGKGILRLGMRADGQSGVLKGLYDQIRIWSRPLSDAEIKAHAQTPGVIPSRNGLVLDKNFDDDTFAKPDWRDATVRLSFKGNGEEWKTQKQAPGEWKILEEKRFTLNCDLPSAKVETVSIKVTAPNDQSCPCTFDKEMNCFMATVNGLKRPKDFGQNGGRNYDDFFIEVSNSGSKQETVPFLLNFQDGFGITGNVPILCDENGVPTGIPVQLSKNWHYGAYKLPYIMLPATPGTTRYTLRTVYGFYGTLPSASHAQLSLIGYGGNGRWDQLAIGSGGESICFDIGMSLTDRTVTDIRGLMFRHGANGTKWGWTDAGHGADWLGLRDSKDKKLLFNDLKTAYLAHGPCLTDVRYDGYYGAERQVELKAQIQTLRTDDYARTFQNLEYGFLKPMPAAKGFLYHLSSRAITPKVVYGNRAGVIADIDVPATAKTGEMLADHLPLAGEGPWWIAFPGATLGQEATGGATGCRALIIRSYEAQFAGTKQHAPALSLIVEDKGDGKKGVACDLVAPKGVTEFKPGDRVRFDMELMTHPRIADDYYGDNQAFIKHLRENPRSWKTVYREAKGNDLEVAVSGGVLLKNYPVIIQVASRTGILPVRTDKMSVLQREATVATVDITGGIGYVPIRFENLDSNDYALYEVKQDKEVLLDQSIHGNDYWQTDYDAASRSYKMTFNLPLDGKPTSKWVLRQIDFGTGSGSTQMTYRDVSYDVHERTKLNFWQAKGQGPRPLLVLIHGGGWLGRDKREVKDVSKYLAQGISVAAINYRYSSIAPLPAPVLDAVRAIQFLRYKATDWNIDKNKIVLSGDSAGGCTSVLIACMPDQAKPDSEDPVERESTRIQGAAGAGAQVSVDPKQLEAWVGPQYAHHGMIVQAVGEDSKEEMLTNYAEHEAIFREFSAINHLSQDDPPIFLAYNSDLTVPATSFGHAIHHGLFGVKFKEKSKSVGHNNVHLAIGKAYTSQYNSPTDFATRVLLKDK
ncbi:MAG: alpha/beta hydrolase fold domain-containing protein [Verrucomicrobia bacterium]|nr:alpha/beta hydrolase fold domain-containing protein [Verrucomicrobiota bacterium]